MFAKHAPVVVGGGRVGQAISKMARPALAVYVRNQNIPRGCKAPIWVCTTNDALEGVVQQLQPSQRQQLIFIQNGMLLPFLTCHGLQHSTQVLLYMSATAEGIVTDGGRTAVYGPLSAHVQQLLQHGGVRCRIIDSWEQFGATMVVKLLWSSTFWLLSAGLDGINVGKIVEQHTPAVAALVAELLPIAQTCVSNVNGSNREHSDAVTAGISLGRGCGRRNTSQDSKLLLDPAAVLQELNMYSLTIAASVPSVEMARKEFPWRNGWFLSKQVSSQHLLWLTKAGCKDLLVPYGVDV